MPQASKPKLTAAFAKSLRTLGEKLTSLELPSAADETAARQIREELASLSARLGAAAASLEGFLQSLKAAKPRKKPPAAPDAAAVRRLAGQIQTILSKAQTGASPAGLKAEMESLLGAAKLPVQKAALSQPCAGILPVPRTASAIKSALFTALDNRHFASRTDRLGG